MSTPLIITTSGSQNITLMQQSGTGSTVFVYVYNCVLYIHTLMQCIMTLILTYCTHTDRVAWQAFCPMLWLVNRQTGMSHTSWLDKNVSRLNQWCVSSVCTVVWLGCEVPGLLHWMKEGCTLECTLRDTAELQL